MIQLKIWVLVALLMMIFPMKVQGEVSTNTELNHDQTILTLKVMTFNIHSAVNWYGSFDLDGLENFIQRS